jgi:hypothetical protein
MSGAMNTFFGGRVDVTPNAVNWANVSGVSPQANANQTIDGITSSISISLTGMDVNTLAYYRINSGSYVLYTAPFSVSNGQTLNFQMQALPATSPSGTITVRNDSSGSATLDTFTYSLTT